MTAPLHPGGILRESYLIPNDISVNVAASRLGMSEIYLDKVLRHEIDVSAQMAYKLAKATGLSPEYWMAAQQEYDLYRHHMTDVGEIREGCLLQ